VKARGVHVVTVCKAAAVVVKMSVYVLAYVVVSVTTDSCTTAAGVAEQAVAETVEEGTSEDESVEINEEEKEVAELVIVDSNTVMIWVVIVSVK
jgi:hypothetical protein